jgi:hypothetical protein
VKNKIISLALIAGLAACSGGNPFDDPEEGTGGGTGGGTDGGTIGDGGGTGINRDGIPPGTTAPSPGSAIFRSEERGTGEGAEQGNGFATGIAYNSASDTFSVDNLAFDGDRPYARGTAVSSLNNNAAGVGQFNVYEGPTTAIDPISGEQVNQYIYRAVYGVSRNRIANADGTPGTAPTTQFAIVRTGSYINYGFGGFIYQRDTSVSLPDNLQATFTGKAAGLRDFSAATGLQYTTADVRINVDFQDFNDGESVRGDGVNGSIFNRRILDLQGTDITEQVAGELGEDVTAIPNAGFIVGPDVLDNNGDLVTDIFTQIPNADGTFTPYETGTFYAIVSGANPNEIVGVFVLESTSAGSRDTSGFIVYRGDPATP